MGTSIQLVQRDAAGAFESQRDCTRRTCASTSAIFCFLCLLLPFACAADSSSSQPKPQPQQLAAYGKLPLYFEANRGQADNSIQFLARGQGYGFFLGPTEAMIALSPVRDTDFNRSESGVFGVTKRGHASTHHHSNTQQIIQMQFVGANPQSTRMAGLEEFPGKVNYFLGNDETKWRRNIPTFAKVGYQELYPGVDLVCYGNQNQLEYDFIVAPGADPNAIALHFEGIDQLEVDQKGDLVLCLPGGQVRQHKPLIYQTVGGVRRELTGAYVLKENNTVGFQIATFDRGQPLVIDPTLSYSTYLGGNGLDQAWDIAVDSAGSAYVVGETLSPNLPTTNAFQRSYAGGFVDRTEAIGGDAFVAKLNSSGSGLVYLTYLGGSGDDQGIGITVDGAGNAFLTGSTDSANFPTRNPIQSGIHGTPDPIFGIFPSDGFVAELDPSGSSLLYSTYFGGVGTDQGIDIAVDGSGNIYVTGFAYSYDLPVTTNALQKVLNNVPGDSNPDAFVAKINPALAGSNALIYCTFLGNRGLDQGDGIAVDDAGCVYVTGLMDFFGKRDVSGSVLFDAFVVKLDATGSSLVYGQLLHSAGNNLGLRIALDAANNAYVTGSTDAGDFPQTPNDLNRGGVFITTDGGGSWSLSSQGLTRNLVRSLAINPTLPFFIYAGTRAGVFASFNAATTWSSTSGQLFYLHTNEVGFTNGVAFTNTTAPSFIIDVNALDYNLVTSIAVDPTSPGTVYAGTVGGVYASEDAGVNWLKRFPTNGVAFNPNVNALLFDPVNPTDLYAGTFGGVFRSTNGGFAWTTTGLSLPTLTIRALGAASDGSALYAGTDFGVAISTNRATNWTTLLGNVAVTALVVDPVTPTTLYAGTSVGIYKRTGTNWMFLSNLVHSVTTTDTNNVSHTNNFSVFVNTLAIAPSAPATVYVGSPVGVFKTSDSGNSWSLLTNGLNALNVASLAVDPNFADIVYAGANVTNTGSGPNCFVTKISSDGADLTYSTVISGNGSDQGWDVAVDVFGNAYVAGATTSTNFPNLNPPSPMQTTNSGGSDAFVFQLNAAGSGLIYSFYLGGRGDDFGYGIGLDSDMNAYITGKTISSNFPTNSPVQGSFRGGASDAFVAKVTAQPSPTLRIARSGNTLVLSWRAPVAQYVLQANDGMGPADWAAIAQTPVVTNGVNTVTIDLLGGHKNFRLKRQ